MYRYYSETRTVEKCDYPNAYSYYSSDLKTLIFTQYGLARVGGEIYYYEPTYNDEYGQTDGVTLYRKSDSSSANAYGYEATPFLKFVDENPDRDPKDPTPPTLVPPKTVEFDGIIYYYNQDEHITFSRNEEGKTNYPIALSNDQKGYITGLKFASNGTENFSVSGTVTFGYKVTDGEEEEKEVSGTCTVTREVTSDGGYKLYVTFGYYRFEISVNYNGDSEASNFTVTGLSYIHTYTSYNYTFLKAIYAMYGIDVDLTDPGTISILANYDEDGNQVGKPKLVTAFTKESGFEDTEGNIFAVNNEFEYTKVESGEDGSYDSYVADFDGEDGQKYRIYVSAQDLSASSVSLSVYQMTIVIVETLTDETSGYTATTERIMASDSSYTRGAIYGIVISKDDTEYEADYIFRLKANDPYTYVYRKLDDDGKATETKYFTFKLTENDKSVNDDFALYKSVDIKYVGEATVHYTASGTNTFVDIMNDKVKLIVYEMSIYIVDECKYDEETTTYTITTTDGKSYSVKMVTTEDGKAVIEVTPIEAATDTEDTAGESTDTEDTSGDSSADDSVD